MKERFLPLVTLICLATSVTLITIGCGTLQREFLGSPQPVALLESNQLPVTVTPPITEQLRAAAPFVETYAPAPWGGLVAAAMNLLATGAASVATFHARNAAVQSAASAKSSASAAASSNSPA